MRYTCDTLGPCDVAVSQLRALSGQDVRDFIDRKLAQAYGGSRFDEAAYQAALECAIAGAFAHNDIFYFDRVAAGVRDARDLPNVQVVRDYAQQILSSGAGAQVRGLYGNGIDFGSKLIGLVAGLKNATDPDLGYTTIRRWMFTFSANEVNSALEIAEKAAFDKLIDSDPQWARMRQDAVAEYRLLTEQQLADMRNAFAKMTWQQRLEFAAGAVFDAGALAGSSVLAAIWTPGKVNSSALDEAVGRWVSLNESMSPRSRAYQEYITGRSANEPFLKDGVKFDGYRDGIYTEAKGFG